MELEKYIKEVGKLMPISINLLTELEASGNKYAFETGADEFPTTFKELYKKIRLIWQKK
jgi:hypothetical protein|tara:strand:+ start:50 stop:226 length:177 start_codon:yes stop_codon:yes gene_type:complete